jgi:hypothetical protein
MVRLEAEAGGIVTLGYHPPYGADDEPAYLAALDRIGHWPGPFALLAVLGHGDHLSAAGERSQALWFKATREVMNRHCRALAIVRAVPGPRTAEVFGRLWTFPILVTADQAAARRFLEGYLP